mmetsp:Transcript_32301/g.68791  ORF Transcript_32301/g.68791 Transcript_32301/m.68791 type:complete len:243 (+) Transcript_32301:328-1056(+)
MAHIVLIHVMEHGLQLDSPVPHRGSQLLEELPNATLHARIELDLVPPRRQRAGGVGHGNPDQGILLKERRGEGRIHILGELPIVEHAVEPHVPVLESFPIPCGLYILIKAADGEGRLHLAQRANALPQRIEVREIDTQTLLHDFGDELIHGTKLMLAPLRAIGLDDQVAPREGRLLIATLAVGRDLFVEGLVTHLSRVRAVALHYQLQLVRREFLAEREEALELEQRDLPRSPGRRLAGAVG